MFYQNLQNEPLYPPLTGVVFLIPTVHRMLFYEWMKQNYYENFLKIPKDIALKKLFFNKAASRRSGTWEKMARFFNISENRFFYQNTSFHLPQCLLYENKKISYPANIYLFKVNNKNTRKRCKIRSKLTIKTPERRK